jgi:serine protease DegS
MKEALKFVTWPAIAGLLAALLILDRLATPQPPQITTGAPSYARAVANASPGVVNIFTAKVVTSRQNPLLNNRRYNSRQRPAQRIEQSLGSGVIMSQQGHILTNNHVIAGADAIQVLLQDGRNASATVIGTDTATDLAVLKIELTGLQPMELGDADSARVGDVVLAIGNPLGFGHSVTQGIISALGRYTQQPNTYEDYIQTDATILQGNSGGALVDIQGRLLGINTLIYTGDPRTSNTAGGISLAIPIDLATFVMRDLIDYGEVIRGWLGVSVDPLSTTDPTRQALLVAAVSPGSPADKAGFMEGDIMTHIDGQPVANGRKTMHDIAMLRPGDTIAISVQRNQQSLELRTVVGTMGQQTTRDTIPRL